MFVYTIFSEKRPGDLSWAISTYTLCKDLFKYTYIYICLINLTLTHCVWVVFSTAEKLVKVYIYKKKFNLIVCK